MSWKQMSREEAGAHGSDGSSFQSVLMGGYALLGIMVLSTVAKNLNR
jgi:hypothetical protein